MYEQELISWPGMAQFKEWPVCLFSLIRVFCFFSFFFPCQSTVFVFFLRGESREIDWNFAQTQRNETQDFQFYQSRFYKPLVAPRCFGVWRPLKKKSSLRRCGRMSLATYTVWFTYAFSILFENVYFVTWKYIRFFQSVTHWRYPEIQRQNASFAPPQAI